MARKTDVDLVEAALLKPRHDPDTYGKGYERIVWGKGSFSCQKQAGDKREVWTHDPDTKLTEVNRIDHPPQLDNRIPL